MEDYYFGAKHLHKTFTIGKRAKTAIAFWQASSQNMLTKYTNMYWYLSMCTNRYLDLFTKNQLE